MGLFDDMLRSDETIFRNPVALEPDYMPKEVPYRENEQHYIAECIKPLLLGRSGKNLLIYGAAGIGKTLAVKSVIDELDREAVDVYPIFVNCWKRRTSYKIMLEICDQLEYKFTHNKNTEELFEVIKKIINKKSAVFVFDEIDRAEDTDFLYLIAEEIYRKSIILISNYENWIANLDVRIKSRLALDSLRFRKYTKEEILGIIRRRIESAFYPGVWEARSTEMIADAVLKSSDIRLALFLLNEAGNNAEMRSSKKVEAQDVERALEKINKYSTKPATTLDEFDHLTIQIINEHKKIKIGDAYKEYAKKGGKGTYKTFQRRIKRLEKDHFIEVEKVNGGVEGKTSILKPKNRKINEFK